MHHGIMISQCKYTQKITNNICKDKNYFGLKAEKKIRFFRQMLYCGTTPDAAMLQVPALYQLLYHPHFPSLPKNE